MAPKNEFVEFVLETMSQFGTVRARAMFGGYGIYKDDLMFALIADDELYLKVDDQNRAEFEEEGMTPFLYVKDGKEMKMSYYHAPESALDSPDHMYSWANSGYEAALRAARNKPRRKRKK